MTDPTFTTHGNEPVEARIVSWVLGEASAFEAAELERLCDAQPELMIFKRRMDALHGLLGEAEKPSNDALWKLTSRKRLPIEKLLCDDDRNEINRAREAAREQRIHRSSWRAGWAIAACVLFAIVALALLDPFDLIIEQKRMMMESPMVVSYMAAEDSSDEDRSNSALADKESVVEMKLMKKSKEGGRMPLSTPIPPELIEGTPKPINVPNLESPVNGPAGGSQMFFSMQESQTGGQKRDESVDRQVSSAPSKPKSPSASMARVITSNAVDPVTIPVPSEQLGTPSIEFGAALDSDQNWGADNNADAFSSSGVDPFAAPPAAAPSEEKARLAGESADPSLTLDDVPVTGRLFDGKSKSSLPAIRGRIIDREEKGAEQFKPLGMASASGRDEGLASEGEESEKIAFYELKAGEKALKRGLDAQDYDDAEGLDDSDKEFLTKLKDQRDELSESLYGKLDADDLRRKVREQEERVKHGVGKVLDNTIVSEKVRYHIESDADDRRLNVSEVKKAKEALEAEKVLLEEMKKALDKLEASAESKPVVPVDAGEETSAAQEPYSTFSLNISDASFRIAQASLAKGEQPDPAGIQVEQFYNAVNYGDPAPAAGQPVAGTVEQVAHPVVPGRTLVRVAIKTAAAGRSPQQALRLTLLTDQSGSMVREDRREAMNQALKGLGDLLTPNDVVNVIGFARLPHLLAEGLQGQQAKQLQGLINMDANEGGTNLEEAIKLGEELAKRYQQQGAQNRVVLFTDGAANLGDADPQSLAKKVEQLRQSGISFDIAGIAADGINDELLAELARKGNGRYYIVGKGESDQLAKQLAGAFNPAAENVKVQVRFNPARVGGYKLIGFEKDRLKKEDFRNDKVDAAEMAAEEAGVAIYQVEPLPEGEGELGEVSVRFRDTATGEMVERTWTIPYDSSAPSIEQATASMQLAVMSMLAGEKLKGGPLADAIDFKQLSKPQANVRQNFGADQRVGEMLQMIDQLK